MTHFARNRALSVARTMRARAVAALLKRRGSIIALCAALAMPGVVRAQAAIFGCPADPSCTGLVVNGPVDDPLLIGFLWPTADRDPAAPDVLFSEEWWGALDGSGPAVANAMLDANGCWIFSPNWRTPQLDDSPHDVFVLTADRIWLDSTPNLASFDLGLVLPQPIGTLSGDAPSVVTLTDRHAVQWHPLKEQAPPHQGGCEAAGAAPRGFMAGYVVWSLAEADYPSPTRHDFLIHGQRHAADLSTLRFDVADPDGLGSSDLDTSDGLTLINPDGVPDTGDELLELQLCPEDGLARWYTVQPVVRGRFTFFDGGGVSVLGLPSSLVDITADGEPDVADLLSDGFYEFSDGCGLGLGLLWNGEIATSLLPGLGEDLVVPPGCGAPPDCDRGRPSGVAPILPVREPSALDQRDVEPLRVREDEAGLVLGWEETLGGRYVIYLGELQVLLRERRYEMTPINPCALLDIPVTMIPMPPGDAYFLVTQVENGAESSYGRDSFGVERPRFDPCP